MTAQFRSFAEIFREEPAAAQPQISPLITQPPPPPAPDRLLEARLRERFDVTLARLLEEIATEVLGRELLLAPADTDAIVRRLSRRYGIEPVQVRVCGDELVLATPEGEIDASLGRRLRAAIDAALS